MGVIPIGGDVYYYSGRPRVTYALILANVVVYVFSSYKSFFITTSIEWISMYALTPVSLLNPLQWYRLFTSMFLHADILHIFFNMYFLYIFGRAIEQTIGSTRYLVLYIVSGVIATCFHTAFTCMTGLETIAVPALGASGAISGVLGAYLLLYPRRKLTICWFLWFIPWCFTLSASSFLILWFALQVIYGYMRLGSIAFFAHVGGFIAGLAFTGLTSYRVETMYRTYPVAPWSQAFYPTPSYVETGLSRNIKSILAILLVLVVAGLVYSTAYSIVNSHNIYIYSIETSHDYGEPVVDQALCSLDRDIISYPSLDEPRIVFNRLLWSGLLFDKPNTYYKTLVYREVIETPFPNARVYLGVNGSFKYDAYGFLEYSRGVMETNVLRVGVNVVIVEDVKKFNYKISSSGLIRDLEIKLLLPTTIISIISTIIALKTVIEAPREPRHTYTWTTYYNYYF